MRCQDCKTCLSAIKNGHHACIKTFKYEKSKKVVETAALYKRLGIYKFLIRSDCPRSFEKEIELCAKNKWLDEYYSFLRYPASDNETKLRIIRSMMYAAIKYGDLAMMNSVYTYETPTFHEAFAEIRSMDNAISAAVNTANLEKIHIVYWMFRDRSEEWSPSDFKDAILTGNIDVLAKVIEMWKLSPQGLRGVTNIVKLDTITNSRIDMLKLLDREINGYPEHMVRQMQRTRGYSTESRLRMFVYVCEEMRRARRQNTASLAMGIVERERERERIEQRQATAAPVAPVQEKVTNLQKALAVIEECDIPEGKYLELCNLLMDVHRRGVRA
jgi:hypothetical protein